MKTDIPHPKLKGVYYGYKIGRNYTKLTIWTFGKMTQSSIMTETVTPNKGTKRRERYEIFLTYLALKNIPSPVYKASN